MKLASCVLILGFTAIGCVRTSTSIPQSFPGLVTPGATYFEFKKVENDKRVPGKDVAQVAYLQWCDSVRKQEDAFVAFVVWTDIESQNYRAQGSGPNNLGEKGSYKFQLGNVLDVKCETADGRTGSVTVKDDTFDLSRGWLILVSTANGEFRTKQIQHEKRLKRIPNQAGGYEEFAELSRDPEIAAFFHAKK